MGEKRNTRYEVLTPNGWKSFDGIRVSQKSSYVKVMTDKGFLTASGNHRVLTKSDWKPAETLSEGDVIRHENGDAKVVSVEPIEAEIALYDLLEVDGGYQYYTNGFVSHNCEFLGSQDTLIKASKIASMAFSEPIAQSPDGLTMYENPKDGNLYMMMVDTSRAIGQDYHAFTILDVTQVPYKVVAKYRNNKLPAAVYPNVLFSVASKYNGAYVLVEINDIGQQVADILRDELEYDNMLEIVVKGKKGQKLGVAFGGAKTYNGVKMSASIKKMGCMALKEMIEGDKIILNDYDIISEFSTYISKSNSYEASTGYHDDLVSTLVMFGWLTTQPYYKELVDLDIRRKIYEDKLKKIEEDLMPFGFVSAGDDNDQDEAARLLSKEDKAKKVPNRRDTSWLADAEELT